MKPTFEPIPQHFIPLYRVKHLKECRVSIGNLQQLAKESPQQPVREYAKMKLSRWSHLNQN
jgi:hypothetical protein